MIFISQSRGRPFSIRIPPTAAGTKISTFHPTQIAYAELPGVIQRGAYFVKWRIKALTISRIHPFT
jgi:hypothetical protein